MSQNHRERESEVNPQDPAQKTDHSLLGGSGEREGQTEVNPKDEEDMGFEPASTTPPASPVDQDIRPIIKPKLIKRDMGVRLTEVRRASQKGNSGRSRAPRGTGPLVEGLATTQLRHERAIKRAAEFISYVSEDIDHYPDLENQKVPQRFGREVGLNSRLTQSPVPEEKQVQKSTSPSPNTQKPNTKKRGWGRWSIAPKSATIDETEEVGDSDVLDIDEDLIQVDEPAWELDEETLSAIHSNSNELSLSTLSAQAKPLGTVSFNHIEAIENSDKNLENALDEHAISPHLFTEQLRLFSDGEDESGRSLDNLSSTSLSYHPKNKLDPKQKIDKGTILWSTSRNYSDFSSHQSQIQSNKSPQAKRGWRLERLQNRVEGAETWLGIEMGEEALQQSAVIKLVWPHLLSDNPMMWQFDAEIQVRALQQVDHVAIPKILDWGEDTERGAWFTVLEWVEGDSLAHHLKRTPLTVDDAVALFAKLGEGLSLCHQEGLIHRKIQPAHIILSPRGPSLISFQWVDEVAGQDLQRAQQGAYQLFGRRPKFLAPEWMQDAMITDAADVYALGACLLESVNPSSSHWRDAPPRLHACLAGALHNHPDERSNIKEFLRDLELSSTRYLYQSGRDGHQPESLTLHEVVSKIRSDELGWHLLGRSHETQPHEYHELVPWGTLEEVVTALERAKRYQSETTHPEPQELGEDLELRREALDERAQQLTLQEEELKRFEEELKWRDEALRVRERELNERDAALQEEAQRLEVLNQELTVQEESLKKRKAQLQSTEETIDHLREELKARSDELESRSASLRIEESEMTRREAEREEELALLRASLESERQRLLAEEREEKDSERARIEAQARALLTQREEALKKARAAEAEARALAKKSEEALQAVHRERAEERQAYEQELEIREATRVASEDLEGAFARVELRRSVITSETPPPDELTHREFEVGGVTFRARYCPPGSTWCGSDEEGARAEERPRHRAKISRGFWLMETPVTQAQWSTLMEDNPSSTQGLDHPVEGMSWVEAALFCNALSEMFKLESAYEFDGDVNFSRNRTRVHWRYRADGFRLPTELEWEYAARAGLSGQRHLYPLGEDLNEVGWFAQNAGGVTHPVGLKSPNMWGLYDLSGNVWEWCHDEWRRESYRSRAQEGARDSVAYNPQLTPRVIRGGAWYDFPSACRLAARPGQDINQGYGIGLRLCLPHQS